MIYDPYPDYFQRYTYPAPSPYCPCCGRCNSCGQQRQFYPTSPYVPQLYPVYPMPYYQTWTSCDVTLNEEQLNDQTKQH